MTLKKRIIFLLICALGIVGAVTFILGQEPPASPATKTPSPEFLKEYDRLLTLVEEVQTLTNRRDQMNAAIEVLKGRVTDLSRDLASQVDKGYKWDAAKRMFVREDAIPAKEMKP